MSRFPLLSLPCLVLRDALKCLNPIELFTLSQCSKRMQKKIKLAGTENFRLQVYLLGLISINDSYRFNACDNNPHDFKTFEWRNFGLNDKKVATPVKLIFPHGKELISYWDDKLVGLKTICFHLSEVFGCKVESFVSGYKIPAVKFRLFIGGILLKQDSISNLTINSNDFTDEDLQWTLDTVKVIETLTLVVKTSVLFRYNFKTFPKILKIYYSFWFSLANLLSLNSCAVIELLGSILSEQDLEQFIIYWKAGNYPKLEYLKVRSNYLNELVPFAGLVKTRNTQNPIPKVKRINNADYEINEGVDIRRDDGIMGTIELKKCSLELLVWN